MELGADEILFPKVTTITTGMRPYEGAWSETFDPGYYRQVSNIRRTLVSNKIVDHSDVVGAAPVGAAPTTSSFST